ncbi:ribonuclease T [Buchnera aphidicola (Chaitoregma tattakana)]|uniref:ribonuclease T n=1 Tax=Buchnera aphidicola TaxID=9 RepID=UPI0031B87FDA
MEHKNNKINYFLKKRFRNFYPVVIDIETAGFNYETDALLEIAAITLKMDKLGWLKKKKILHYHIKPFIGSIVNEMSIKFNKIDPFSPLRGAVSEKVAINKIIKKVQEGIKLEKCKKGIIVAHNSIFDLNFFMSAIKRNKIKKNPFHTFVTFDTATLSGLALGQTVLAKACKNIGIYFDNKQAHSAIYDATQTANLFCKIVNKWKKLGGWPIKKM